MTKIYWAYKGDRYASPVLATPCAVCGKSAIVKLEGIVLAEQTDGTTHVCHPLAGGCNHGFEAAPAPPTVADVLAAIEARGQCPAIRPSLSGVACCVADADHDGAHRDFDGNQWSDADAARMWAEEEAKR